jgi:hypothetical protein
MDEVTHEIFDALRAEGSGHSSAQGASDGRQRIRQMRKAGRRSCRTGA